MRGVITPAVFLSSVLLPLIHRPGQPNNQGSDNTAEWFVGGWFASIIAYENGEWQMWVDDPRNNEVFSVEGEGVPEEADLEIFRGFLGMMGKNVRSPIL
jgi:hypothetical protein